MVKKYLAFCFSAFALVIALQAQPTPYKRTTPLVLKNTVGTYPNLRNNKTWEGHEPGKYSIKFQIKGTKPGDTVYLADHHLDGKYLRDTAVVDHKGIANFTGNFKLQRGFYLYVFPGKTDFFEFIVDDDQDFTIIGSTLDSADRVNDRTYYSRMKVVGSLQNAAYVTYQVGMEDLLRGMAQIQEDLKNDTLKLRQDELNAKRKDLLLKRANYDSVYIANHKDHILSRFLWAMEDVEVPKAIQDAGDSASYVYYKAHYWDHIDFQEDALIRLPRNIMKQKLDFFFDKVIVPDADTCIKYGDVLLEKSKGTLDMEKYLIWYLTNRFEGSNIMGLDKAFVYMAQRTYCSGKAWWVDSATIEHMCDNAKKRSHTLIGNIAPSLELADQNGNWVNTASIRAPYTIVIFWDPTCGHCREVMPKLAKIYEENKQKGWKVVALASGDKRKEWVEYLKEHPEMSGFIHLIRGEVRSQQWADNLYKYYVIASPTIFVLDESKKILANRIDVDKLEEFINHFERLEGNKGEGKTTNPDGAGDGNNQIIVPPAPGNNQNPPPPPVQDKQKSIIVNPPPADNNKGGRGKK